MKYFDVCNLFSNALGGEVKHCDRFLTVVESEWSVCSILGLATPGLLILGSQQGGRVRGLLSVLRL